MIEIRLPRVADEVGCRTLAAAVIGEERAGAFIRSHLERHHLIVAEGLGEVVGFLAYRIDWFQCTFVSLVVVRDDFRRKGIGSALVEAALKFCQQHGYLKITLDTFMEREPAIKLFEKFRFHHNRTRKVGGKELMYFYLDLYVGEDRKKHGWAKE